MFMVILLAYMLAAIMKVIDEQPHKLWDAIIDIITFYALIYLWMQVMVVF